MAYTRAWDETVPNGATTNANTIDTEIQNVKVDIRERLVTAFGLSGESEFDDDPFVVKSMAFAQGTITADAQVFSCTATWNNAGVTFTAIKLNVTNTNSNAASKLIDLQTGGVSQFSVTRAGVGAFAGAVSMAALTATTGTFSGTLTHSSAAANLVQNTGSSGTVSVGATDSTGTVMTIRTASGGRAQYAYHTGASIRWSMYKSESAESGGNAGSSWVLAAYDDAGVNIDLPIVITRAASGNMALSRPVIMSSTLAVTGTITGSASLIAGAASVIGFTGRSTIDSGGTDGILSMKNNAGTGFTRLAFGPATSSFAAIRVGGTTTQLEFVLADNSAYALARALTFVATTSVEVGTANIATTGSVRLSNNTSIAWRNAANSANHALTLNASDNFTLSAPLAVTGFISSTTSLTAATTITAGTGLTVSAGGITVTGNSTITGTLGISSTITSTLGAIASSTPAWSSTATFNAGGVAFTHIFANITDTASANGSDLIDLQVGGVSQFSVTKTGSGFWPTNAIALSVAGHNSSTANIVAGTSASQALSLEFSGAVTTDKPLLTMLQTWNAGAVTFTAIKLNVTNTASAATSMLIDLQVGGTTQFKVTRGGIGTLAGGLTIQSGQLVVTSAATNIFIINELGDPTNEFGISHDGAGEWTIRSGPTSTAPLVFAAGSLHFNNGAPVSRPDYTAASGTASRATYDTATVTTEQLAQRVKAIIDDMLSFGLFT